MRNTTIFALIFLCLTIVTSSRQVTLRNQKLYDKQQREITLHGTNVVVKVPPYIPSTGNYNSVHSFGPDDIQNLKQNGYNSIRLGVMWAGVEPQKDTYNQTYLQQMLNIVNKAGQAGIYTLVEFHQDLLSQTFCGDGVPIWLIQQLKLYKTFPFPMNDKIQLNSQGIPQKSNCSSPNWSKYYFSYDVGQGINDLYNPNHKLNHKFVKYWQKVALTFKGNPFVIAYELINEPFVGNVWRDPLLILPSMAERMKLQGLYDRLSQKIRAIDAQTPLCFQPVTFDNFVPSGFSHAPGGKRYANQSIFCYHHYQPPALNLTSLDTYVKDAKRLNVGSILSQTYGSQETLDRAEYWKQSWMYWIYKDFGNVNSYARSSNFQSKNMKLNDILRNPGMQDHLVRTYFQRVAGSLQSSTFDSKTGHFTGIYWAKIGGNTILYLNKQRIYSNNYEINAFPQNDIQINENGNFISLKYIGVQENKKIMITVIKL